MLEDKLPPCESKIFRQCIQINDLQCKIAAKEVIHEVNLEILAKSKEKNIGNNEIAEYQKYMAGQYIGKLRIELEYADIAKYYICVGEL